MIIVINIIIIIIIIIIDLLYIVNSVSTYSTISSFSGVECLVSYCGKSHDTTHLMTGHKGKSEFCFLEIVNIHGGKARRILMV